MVHRVGGGRDVVEVLSDEMGFVICSGKLDSTGEECELCEEDTLLGVEVVGG